MCLRTDSFTAYGRLWINSQHLQLTSAKLVRVFREKRIKTLVSYDCKILWLDLYIYLAVMLTLTFLSIFNHWMAFSLICYVHSVLVQLLFIQKRFLVKTKYIFLSTMISWVIFPWGQLCMTHQNTHWIWILVSLEVIFLSGFNLRIWWE